jgi:predicted unusual protein kinase regulating ubiquinone biosynthesis (AarF/ABC1/UbiB family)
VTHADDTFARIDALIGVGLRLARTSPSGRVLLARLADVLDPAWLAPDGVRLAQELSAARAQVAQPLELRRVESALREAWGVAPTEELDDLDATPAAVTPTAQVHRGRLDGRPVAVKVLRPGIAAAVRRDLALLENLLVPLRAAFPAQDAAAVVGEFRERVLDELDLEHEAAVQRRFYRALRHHPFLRVPSPVTRLARETVLVSEWIEGVPLSDATDRDRACARLVAFAMGAARAGLVHADFDPRDVLVEPDGRLAVLDFGATRIVARERLDHAAAALDALVGQDEAAFGAATAALGWLGADQAGHALGLAQDVLGELAGPDPVRLDRDAVLTLRDRGEVHREQVAALVPWIALPPDDLWPARGLAQLFGTIARVGATGSWREQLRAALRDGWDVSA